MDEKDWLFLQTLYNEKNLTRTAQRLFITQPALTYRLNQLEEEFNIKVFIRGKGLIQFTTEGEILAQYAKKMLRDIHVLKAQLKKMQPLDLELNISTSGDFSHMELPAILSQFSTIHSEIKFNISSCDSSNRTLDCLSKAPNHIAFMRGDFEFDGFRLLLRSDPVCIISRKIIKLEQLWQLPRIIYNMSSHAQQKDDQWWNEHFTQPPCIKMLADRTQTCIEMVKQDLGYAILPINHIKLASTLDGLHILPLMNKDGTPVIYRFWLFCSWETAKLTISKNFIKFLKQYYVIK